MTPLAVLRYAWAAPASALGLLVAAAAVLLGAHARRVDGVLEVAGGRLAGLVGRLPPQARFCAITLGHVVVGIGPDVLDHVRSHEHAHVRQYERWGLLFFPLYAAASVVAWLNGGRPYWHNHFERQARRAARADEPDADVGARPEDRSRARGRLA
jgi:hypothetical protein